MKHRLLLIGMTLILVGLLIIHFSIKYSRSLPDDEDNSELVINAEDDPAMQAAFDKARDSLDYFLDVVDRAPEGTQGYSIKVGIPEGDKIEFFWVYPFTYDELGFMGRVNNDPKIISNVANEEIIEFSRGQIVDWTFDDTQTETMMGNFTGCVLLEQQAPENAKQFMEFYGLKCDK